MELFLIIFDLAKRWVKCKLLTRNILQAKTKKTKIYLKYWVQKPEAHLYKRFQKINFLEFYTVNITNNFENSFYLNLHFVM